jgi:hypothetical protein
LNADSRGKQPNKQQWATMYFLIEPLGRDRYRQAGVLIKAPEASQRLSGMKATDVSGRRWPARTRRG